MKTRFAVCLFAAGLAVGIAAPACAQTSSTRSGQDYPVKPIRIVTSPAGGGNDFPARLIARALAGPLGQQIVVDNRATILIADIVRQAPPDGYTLLVTGSAHWIGPLLGKVTYDPVRDFAPITLIDRAPSVLVVHPSMPLKSVKQMIALAKKRPGEMNFSVGGPGSSGYLGALLFNHMAGVKIVSIPYKGTAPALGAVMGGEVHALFAPAGTPAAAIALLNREVGNYLRSPEAQKIFLKAGIEPSPGTPEEFSAIMNSEVERIGAVLKATGTGAR